MDLFEKQLRDFEAQIDFSKPITHDVETMSGDDEREALHPYHGDRTTLIGLYQGEYEKQYPIMIPIRHATEGKNCWPIDLVLPWFKEFIAKCTTLDGQNIKFESHFAWVDGIDFSHLHLRDTMDAARIVNNVLPNYKLGTITDYFCVQFKKSGEAVSEWCTAHNTKDYGRVPLEILIPYLKYDLLSTDEAMRQIISKMSPEELQVFNENSKHLKKLMLIEREGFLIDKKLLLKKKIVCLQEMLRLARDIKVIAGFDLNPNSDSQVGNYFNSIGIHSHEMTEGGKDSPPVESWNKNVLKVINDDKGMADLLVEFSSYAHQEANFCTAWLDRCAPDGRIHPTFWNSGTNSGRGSSSDPNAHNYPEWFAEALIIEDGYVGIKWDLSQIEYRIFCHYGNDEKKIKSYLDDPDIDYHQILADDLGLPRKPVKTLNFAMLFGMGKAKTIRSIKKDIASVEKDPKTTTEDKIKLRHTLRKFARMTYGDAADTVVPLEGKIEDEVFQKIALSILEVYHRKAPEIKRLQTVVKESVWARGYVRNFYGRRYRLTYDKSYIGLNRVIQGSAADFFKYKVNALFDDPRMPKSVKLVNEIHDAIKAKMKLEDVYTYVTLCKEIIETSPFRVPLRIDMEAALYNWGNYTKIKNTTNQEGVLEALCLVSTLPTEVALKNQMERKFGPYPILSVRDINYAMQLDKSRRSLAG